MHTHELELPVLTELHIELYILASTLSQEKEKDIGNKKLFLEKGLEQIKYALETIEMLHSN